MNIKMKNKILLLFIAFTINAFAQTTDKIVTLVVSGQGKTQEEAKQNALRSAIEQAFGTFISSKTEILNDSIVADQIASVSSGNIKSFEILNEAQLPNGTSAATLRVIVSVDKLTSFVEAKGVAVEINGGLFAVNIKQQILNEMAEINAVAEMIGVLHEVIQTAFDYEIKSGEPQSADGQSQNWEIPMTVTATANKNMDFFSDYFMKTISAISLSPTELENYRSLNKRTYAVTIENNGLKQTFYLRKRTSALELISLGSNWEYYLTLFEIDSGLDIKNGNSLRSFVELNRYFANNEELINKTIREDGLIKLHNLSNSFGGYINDINNYSDEDHFFNTRDGFNFSLLKSGQIAATFLWIEKRTLSQIEQMKGFSIKPLGVKSQYKNGGYIFYRENGHGIVLAPFDYVPVNWYDAQTFCNGLIFGGFSDWQLPTKEDWLFISEIHKIGLGSFIKENKYWSSTEINTGEAYSYRLKGTYAENWNKTAKFRVRPIRIF
jgi:hypothetical protein